MRSISNAMLLGSSVPVDTIDLGSWEPCNRTELTASTSPDKLLVSDSGIVDHGRHFNVFLCPLAGLECGAESPGECLAGSCR